MVNFQLHNVFTAPSDLKKLPTSRPVNTQHQQTGLGLERVDTPYTKSACSPGGRYGPPPSFAQTNRLCFFMRLRHLGELESGVVQQPFGVHQQRNVSICIWQPVLTPQHILQSHYMHTLSLLLLLLLPLDHTTASIIQMEKNRQYIRKQGLQVP